MNYSLSEKKLRLRGFTLTEIAIVLGIVGILIGGIWATASQIGDTNKVNTTIQQVITLETAVRALYGQTNSFSAAEIGAGDLNAPLTAANLLPASMACNYSLPPPKTCDLWGDWWRVTPTADAQHFQLVAGQDVPYPLCARVIMGLLASGATHVWNANGGWVAPSTVTLTNFHCPGIATSGWIGVEFPLH